MSDPMCHTVCTHALVRAALSLACCAVFATVRAEVADADEAAIQRRVESELKPLLDRFVDAEGLARVYGFPWPVPPPELAPDEVQAVIDRRVDEAVQETYPDSWVQQQYAHQAHLHEPWQVGSRVRVGLKNGEQFDGYLREIGEFGVRVGPTRIRFDDMLPVDRMHLDRKMLAAARRRTLTSLRQRLAALRAECRRDARQRISRKEYKGARYLCVRGDWVSWHDWFQQQLQRERERQAQFLRPALVARHRYHAGYRPHADEWYPADEIEAVRAAAAKDEAGDTATTTGAGSTLVADARELVDGGRWLWLLVAAAVALGLAAVAIVVVTGIVRRLRRTPS